MVNTTSDSVPPTTPSAIALPPTPVSPEIQAALDADHLRLLEIGFYVSGVVTALRFLWLMLMAGFFATVGLTAAVAAQHSAKASTDEMPPAFIFLFFALIFGAIIFLTLVFAGLEIYAGRCLKRREHPILIQVIAAFYCISIPWGTALGVATFMVLNRTTVKPLFERRQTPGQAVGN